MPFFSIIIPTYNRASFLEKTITSLLDQTFQDFEINIVDDGSTDNTEDVVKSINSPKVKYFKKVNGERGAARNYGAALSACEYLNFFDSDDLAYPNHLQVAFEFIVQNQQPELIHLNYDICKLGGEKVREGFDHIGNIGPDIIIENILSCNGVFIRKDIAAKYPFPEDRDMAVSEDWALWLTLASRYPIWHCNTVSSTVVLHDERSILDWNPEKVIKRDKLLIDYLLADPAFRLTYKRNIGRFIADRYTFFMLILAINNKKKQTLKYALKAAKNDITVVYRKRFIAALLKLIK